MDRSSDAPDGDLRRRLAVAVAVPDAMVWPIDADNRRGHSPLVIDVATARDVSFYVKVAPGILSVDFDAEDAEDRAAALYLALRELGLLPVLLASGGRG